jgi:hypothetical protein
VGGEWRVGGAVVAGRWWRAGDGGAVATGKRPEPSGGAVATGKRPEPSGGAVATGKRPEPSGGPSRSIMAQPASPWLNPQLFDLVEHGSGACQVRS